MSSIIFGVLVTLICLVFFPDYPSKTPFTEFWWSVFIMLAVAKTLFIASGIGVIRSMRIYKELYPEATTTPEFGKQMQGAIAYTLLNLPLVAVGLKLSAWLPVGVDFLGIVLSFFIFRFVRRRAANIAVPDSVPTEKKERYKDYVALADLSIYAWRPAALVAILTCVSAWSL